MSMERTKPILARHAEFLSAIRADSTPPGKLVKRIVAGASFLFHGTNERAHLLALEVSLRALAIPADGIRGWLG